MNRKYNIDAYRNASDLGFKLRAKIGYNNLVLSCYDTALLFLMDVYYSPSFSFPPVHRVTVPDIVKCIATKDPRVCTLFGEYVSMFKTYYAVYNGKVVASASDVERAMSVINHIIEWYVENIDYENLVEIFHFVLSDTPLDESRSKPSIDNRHYIGNVLGLYNIGE